MSAKVPSFRKKASQRKKSINQQEALDFAQLILDIYKDKKKFDRTNDSQDKTYAIHSRT